MNENNLELRLNERIDYEFNRSFSLYDIQAFRASENPEGAIRAQQIQGESYVEAGFVHESGLDEYGRLLPELDRSRGDNVTYFIASPSEAIPGNEHEQASVRVIDIPEGGSVEDLAAYRYSMDSIEPRYEGMIRESLALHGTDGVKEIAALSKTNGANPAASYEIIREILQRAIRRNKDEVWVATLAPNAFKSMLKSFGPEAIVRIGDDIEVDPGDDRTSDELRLIPSMVLPCYSPDSIMHAAQDEKKPALRRRIVKSLLLVVDGLDEHELSDDVRQFIAQELTSDE